MARYLGITIDWGMYWLGQAWLVLVQFSIHALNEYFELPAEQHNSSKLLLLGSTQVLELGKLTRPMALWSSVISAMAAGLVTVLIIQGSSGSEILTILLVLAIVGIAYSIPPLRLSATGYGELVLSFLISAIVPIFSFTLQEGEFHRILVMTTFPLVLFFIAFLLIVEFPMYATDLKHQRPSLLLRLGWRRGIVVHNVLVSGGFLLVAFAVIIGLPWRLAIPVASVIPVALAQIILLNRIGQGAKPNWNLLFLCAAATYGMTVYFLTYGFWTH